MLYGERCHQRLRPRAESERGAVAVEFALVLPILVMLLLGITTAGLSYTRAIGLTNAVREGARFGATADATAATAWANDVVSRVRSTQFDDPSGEASVCVQLWKKGTGQLAGVCDTGAVSGLSLPTTATQAPAVPSDLVNGACVVRVVGARNFTINIGLAKWDPVNTSTSVARYERVDEVLTCKVTP